VYNNYIHHCTYGFRLETGSASDIHDNDFYHNSWGVLLEQSQPYRLRRNNFGWTGGDASQGWPDPNWLGLFVNYLESDNIFVNNRNNNFHDGTTALDIQNLTAVTLMAKRNYWADQSIEGPVNANFPLAEHFDDAGPGGATGKASVLVHNSESPLPT